MKRVFGAKGIQLIECINPYIRKYRIRWDVQPHLDEENNDTVTFLETEILHKPTMAEVKKIVLNGYNEVINENIVSGFKWKDMQVWLSSENQLNYKAAYDLAIQSSGANLPVIFKFGDSDDPIYHQFDTIEELSDFYLKAMSHINKQLIDGWAMKDNINWALYEECLKKH